MLIANGHIGGNLNDVKKVDAIIVSQEIVAADSSAATFFGLTPDDLFYMQSGVMIGLGRNDFINLNIGGFSIRI